MKLKILAEAASEFYSTPDLQLRGKHSKREHPRYENAHRTKARHVCQWVACEALTPRYKKSTVGRFWGMDRTAVYYGCKMVRNRIDTDPAEKKELKEFMDFITKRINGTK